MAKKMQDPTITAAAIAASQDEEINALLSARVLKIQGHTMSIEMAGDRTLHIRNASFDENAETAFNFGDPNLCKALVTSWLSIANGAYPVLLPKLHLKTSWEQLLANPIGVQEHVGYILGGAELVLPAEWKGRILEMPRQAAGVFELEYMGGHLKISREMKDSHYTEGEYEGYGGPKHQRNTFNKHIALDILLTGASCNLHYFPSGVKWLNVVEPSVDMPIAERIEVANKNTGASIVRSVERGLARFATQLEEKGEKYVSKVGQVKLVNGVILNRAELLGKEFLRWRGPVYLGKLGVTEKNIDTFLGSYGKARLALAVNDGSYDIETGFPIK